MVDGESNPRVCGSAAKGARFRKKKRNPNIFFVEICGQVFSSAPSIADHSFISSEIFGNVTTRLLFELLAATGAVFFTILHLSGGFDLGGHGFSRAEKSLLKRGFS